MARTLRIAKHEIRFVYDKHAKAGTFHPCLLVFLKGPNGSISGFGPKGWPTWLANRFLAYYETPGRWTNTLHLYLPTLKFRHAFKLRKVGGLKLYKLQYRIY